MLSVPGTRASFSVQQKSKFDRKRSCPWVVNASSVTTAPGSALRGQALLPPGSCVRASVRSAALAPIWRKNSMKRPPNTRIVPLAYSDSGNGLMSPRVQPSDRVLDIWRKAEAVCFDVDCTITVNDSLDLLAEFMGVKDAVEALTNKAMDGSMNLEQALEERLKIINCTPNDIRAFLRAHPPSSRLTPSIKELIFHLQARGVAVYLISGGFRELSLPIAKELNIPAQNVFANRMNWQWDDETGEPTRLVGFDSAEPTAHNRGKPQAIARIRQRNPYNTVVMIGDGITDLEAVQETGGADLFVGYGGVVERQAVSSQAEWFVYDYQDLLGALKRYKVAMVGSGAWASAAVRMVAQNCKADDPADEFVDDVSMWVYEEDWQGGKLSEVINGTHTNPKYLPGVALGDNVVAVPDLEEAVKDADIILFCAPHQFMHGICKQLRGKVRPDAIAASLTKGMRVRSDGPQLISALVQRQLGIDCSVLMGANIAGDIGKGQLSEAVIGYNNLANAMLLKKLFETPYFTVIPVPDAVGAEMCGTLKNVVALAAGMVDGLDYGPNSKAAVMRQGLTEMRTLAKALYPTVRDETFFESCGVADLIATCYGGRNRLVAYEWTRAIKAGTRRSWEDLETEILRGQKLQGVLTSNEVQEILRMRGWEASYPLFTTVNRVVNGLLPVDEIVNYREAALHNVTVEVDELGLPTTNKKLAAKAASPL